MGGGSRGEEMAGTSGSGTSEVTACIHLQVLEQTACLSWCFLSLRVAKMLVN